MKSRFGSLISTLAAVLSSSCCVLPLALSVLGLTGIVGPFAVLMRYQPIIRAISLLMLAVSLYLVYRPQARADCAKGGCTPRRLRRQRWIVWISAGLMALFIILSYIPITMTLSR